MNAAYYGKCVSYSKEIEFNRVFRKFFICKKIMLFLILSHIVIKIVLFI